MDRRTFAKSALATGAGVLFYPGGGFSATLQQSRRKLKKGTMWSSIGVGSSVAEKFQAAKVAGFDGVEVMSHFDRSEVLKAREATGLEIPSVCNALHWKFLLSHPDADIRAQGVDALKTTIEDAAAYGVGTILLVPGRVNQEISYDQCWSRSVEEIKKVIPLAEKHKVEIAIENVWNNFLLSPVEAAYYVDQFNSPFVKFYFDCGNILAYGWPEQWIRILGRRIAKIHVKEYSTTIADTQGKRAGFGVKLMEGDVNWPEVMKAVDEIGYTDYMTIEQPGGNTPEGLRDLCERLAKIIDS